MRSTLIVTTALIVLSVFFIVVNGRTMVNNEKQLLRTNMKAHPHACVDTPGWTDRLHDYNPDNCDDYRNNHYCKNGAVIHPYGNTPAGDGAEKNCCGCGKKAAQAPAPSNKAEEKKKAAEPAAVKQKADEESTVTATEKCVDTPKWTDQYKYGASTCQMYRDYGWCPNGKVKSWYSNEPEGNGAEKNCCGCGKKAPIAHAPSKDDLTFSFLDIQCEGGGLVSDATNKVVKGQSGEFCPDEQQPKCMKLSSPDNTIVLTGNDKYDLTKLRFEIQEGPKRHGDSTHKDMYRKFLTKDNIRKINRNTIEYDFDCTSEPHKWRCDFTREYKFRKHHVDASDMGAGVCWKMNNQGGYLVDFTDPKHNPRTGRVPIPNCRMKGCQSPATYNWVHVFNGNALIEKCLVWTDGDADQGPRMGFCCGEKDTDKLCNVPGVHDLRGRRRRRLLRSRQISC